MSRLTINEREALVKSLRKVISTSPEFANDLAYYNKLLNRLWAFGYPTDADDQNALNELIEYATTQE